MKTFSKRLFAALALTVFLLVGCATAPQTVTITQVQTKVLNPPPSFTTPTAKPVVGFNREDYTSADWATRAQLTSVLTVNLYASLSQCNADKAELRAWYEREKKRYDKTP